MQNKQTLDLIVVTEGATRLEDVGKKRQEHSSAVNDMHEQAKEFMLNNPNANITTKAKFTGLSFKLFNNPEDKKKFLEQFKVQDENPKETESPRK